LITLEGVDGMNELNLVSPVNNVSPVFIGHSLHQNPTLVKQLHSAIGKICAIEKQNSTNKWYLAINEIDHDIAAKTLRKDVPPNCNEVFQQHIRSRFMLLAVEVDERNNIMLKCLSADPDRSSDPMVYWVPFYARNMKLSVID
jgi:hypothetical protein